MLWKESRVKEGGEEDRHAKGESGLFRGRSFSSKKQCWGEKMPGKEMDRILPPQLEKNHVVPTSWQDEALARDGVTREVPCSALKGETVPAGSSVQGILQA